MDRLPQAVLWLSTLVFFGFGVAFFLQPAGLAATVDLGVETATARTEIRAMYGGLEIGLALFLAGCALSRKRVPTGLVASALAFLGIGAGRLGGILLAGESTPLLWQLLAAETLAAALSLGAWWWATQRAAGAEP